VRIVKLTAEALKPAPKQRSPNYEVLPDGSERCLKCARVDVPGYMCWRVGHLTTEPKPAPAECTCKGYGDNPSNHHRTCPRHGRWVVEAAGEDGSKHRTKTPMSLEKAEALAFDIGGTVVDVST